MDKEFFKRLMVTYKTEADEHIRNLTFNLIEFEKNGIQKEKEELIEELYREIHSLKGASRAVGIVEIESICKQLEEIFSCIKKLTIPLDKALFNIIHLSINLIKEFIFSEDEESKFNVKNHLDEKVNQLKDYQKLNQDSLQNNTLDLPEESEYGDDFKKDDAFKSNNSISKVDAKDDPDMQNEKSIKGFNINDSQEKTLRVSSSVLDSLLNNIEELLPVKVEIEELTNEVKEIKQILDKLKNEWNKISNYSSHTSRRISNNNSSKESQYSSDDYFSLIENHSEFIEELVNRINTLNKTIHQTSWEFTNKHNILIAEMKDILMFQFSDLFDLFPKIVRDLAFELDKSVELYMSGTELKIDRRILYELKVPFIHILRNIVDHGIESADERIEAGKNQRGIININISQTKGSSIRITIKDDGRGIDIQKVKDAAVKRKIITNDQANKLCENELKDLIFLSEVSTSSIVTDISGRGLGMAIVKEKIEKLGGSIMVKSEKGRGTVAIIDLPVALSSVRGILIRCSDFYYVIPAANIEQVIRQPLNSIKTVEAKETVLINDVPVAFVYLHDLLDIKRNNVSNNTDVIPMLLINLHSKQIAFGVDEVLIEREIIIKPLGKQLFRVRNIAGATILNNGKVVPVVNIHDLFKSVEKQSEKIKYDNTKAEKVTKKVLVVDDSITSRILMKDIIEGAGYNVKLSIDGIDAYTQLKSDKFDLVVSDVEMPRMNGFDLTKKIKSSSKLKDVPVILVTALGNREDKERGIDAGADAYIVKGDFDQTNLLEVIKRLI